MAFAQQGAVPPGLFPTGALITEEDSEGEEMITGSKNEADADDNIPLIDKETSCKDRWNSVLFIFTFIGVVGTVPWNFFITADEYWQYKFRDANHTGPLDPTKRTVLQAHFESYLSIASMVSGTVGFLICTLASSRCSIHSRIIVPLILVAWLFGVTIVFVTVNTDQWQVTFCLITLLTMALMNGLTAFFQASSFGLAGMMSVKFVQAMMTGQAIGGILASVGKIFTVIVDISVTTSALYYFGAACGMMLACVLTYLILLRTMFYRFHSRRALAYKSAQINEASLSISSSSQNSLWAISKRIRLHAISVILVFTVTLAIFPALAVLVVSVNQKSTSPWTGKYFAPFTCFLLYNCGDFCGRCIASWIHLIPARGIVLPVVCALRVVFIPLFLLCNAQPRYYLPVLLDSDVIFIALMATFSVSNGYLASICMMDAPKPLEPQHHEKANILMSFFMALGISLGAVLSNLVVRLI